MEITGYLLALLVGCHGLEELLQLLQVHFQLVWQ
jgi:hypothetical protein